MPERPLSEIARSHAQHWFGLARTKHRDRAVPVQQVHSTARLLEKLAEAVDRKDEALKRIHALAAEATLLTEATVEIGVLAGASLEQPIGFDRDLFEGAEAS